METIMILKQQAETFMTQIQTRRRNPAKQATVKAYRSYLNKWILPLLGDEDLAKIENGLVKNFIQKLSEARLSAVSISGIFNVIKQIMASAVDENGNQRFPRRWNHEFIDMPMISSVDQKSPCVGAEAIQQALGRAKGQDKALYALLAGSGLRIGEAFALMVGPDDDKNSFWQPETGVVTIRTTMANGGIQLSPKTEAGNRQVDLAPELNSYLCELLLDNELPSYGLVFANAVGGPVRQMTAYKHLRRVGVPGFHSFRRFRVTHLRKNNVPERLIKFWIGHHGMSSTDRYDKIGQDAEVRRDWAAKAGLGFSLVG